MCAPKVLGKLIGNSSTEGSHLGMLILGECLRLPLFVGDWFQITVGLCTLDDSLMAPGTPNLRSPKTVVDAGNGPDQARSMTPAQNQFSLNRAASIKRRLGSNSLSIRVLGRYWNSYQFNR